MVKKMIFSSEKGAYVAPVSKTYSVVLESVIAESNRFSDKGTENMTTDPEEDF